MQISELTMSVITNNVGDTNFTTVCVDTTAADIMIETPSTAITDTYTNVTILHQEKEITIVWKYITIDNESQKYEPIGIAEELLWGWSLWGIQTRDSVQLVKYYNENMFRLLHNF